MILLNIDKVRAYFPALGGKWTFFDNAGGSQTLQQVVYSWGLGTRYWVLGTGE